MKRFVAILMTILMLFSFLQGALRESVVKADGQAIWPNGYKELSINITNPWPVLNVGVVIFKDSIYNCYQIGNALSLWVSSVKDDYKRINRDVNISIHKVTRDTFDQVVFNSDKKIWMYIGDMKDVPMKMELTNRVYSYPFILAPTNWYGVQFHGTLERGVVVSSLAVPDADEHGQIYSNEDKLSMVLRALCHFTDYHNGSTSYKSFVLGRIGFNPNELDQWNESFALGDKYRIENFIEGCFADKSIEIGSPSNDIFKYYHPTYAVFMGHGNSYSVACLNTLYRLAYVSTEEVKLMSPAFLQVRGCDVNSFMKSDDGKYLGDNWGSLVFDKGAVAVYGYTVAGQHDFFGTRPAIIRGYSVAEAILFYPKVYFTEDQYAWIDGSLFGDPTLRLVNHPLKDDRQNLPPIIEASQPYYVRYETNSTNNFVLMSCDPENDPVSFSVVSAPPEVEVELDPDYSNKLALVNSNSPGTYEIKIGVTDNQEGRGLNTISVFITFADRMSAPELSSPVDGVEDIVLRLRMYVRHFDSWGGEQIYHIQLASDPNFSNIVLDQELSFPFYVEVPFDLSPLTIYYWRAQRIDGYNTSPWSEVWSFTTMYNPNDPPSSPSPQLVSPQNNSTGISIKPTLSWQDLGKEYLYSLYLYSEDNSFHIDIGGLNGNSLTLPKLENNKSYHWSITACRSGFMDSLPDPSDTWKFTTNSTLAPSLVTVIILRIGQASFTVNGVSNTLDSPPIIKNSRTLVPIRAIVEALGGTIDWNPTEKKVTINLGTTTIELWIGKPVAKVNGIDTPIDSTNPKVVPEIINSRTMLPLRFVTENLGCDVQWDGTTQTITITYPKS